MSLEFQERVDGYRVVRMVAGHEYMIASLRTKRPLPSDGVTNYEDLPIEECTIHSAIGEMTFGDIKEILSHLEEIPVHTSSVKVKKKKE